MKISVYQYYSTLIDALEKCGLDALEVLKDRQMLNEMSIVTGSIMIEVII
jgi:hypothetical protein